MFCPSLRTSASPRPSPSRSPPPPVQQWPVFPPCPSVQVERPTVGVWASRMLIVSTMLSAASMVVLTSVRDQALALQLLHQTPDQRLQPNPGHSLNPNLVLSLSLGLINRSRGRL